MIVHLMQAPALFIERDCDDELRNSSGKHYLGLRPWLIVHAVRGTYFATSSCPMHFSVQSKFETYFNLRGLQANAHQFYWCTIKIAHTLNGMKCEERKRLVLGNVRNLLRTPPLRLECFARTHIKIHLIRSDDDDQNHSTCNTLALQVTTSNASFRSHRYIAHLVTFYILFDRFSTLDSSWRFAVFFHFSRFISRLDVHLFFSLLFSLQFQPE